MRLHRTMAFIALAALYGVAAYFGWTAYLAEHALVTLPAWTGQGQDPMARLLTTSVAIVTGAVIGIGILHALLARRPGNPAAS